MNFMLLIHQGTTLVPPSRDTPSAWPRWDRKTVFLWLRPHLAGLPS